MLQRFGEWLVGRLLDALGFERLSFDRALNDLVRAGRTDVAIELAELYPDDQPTALEGMDDGMPSGYTPVPAPRCGAVDGEADAACPNLIISRFKTSG